LNSTLGTNIVKPKWKVTWFSIIEMPIMCVFLCDESIKTHCCPKQHGIQIFFKNDMGGKHEGMEMCDKDVVM
jgi:hypothetical protein